MLVCCLFFSIYYLQKVTVIVMYFHYGPFSDVITILRCIMPVVLYVN